MTKTQLTASASNWSLDWFSELPAKAQDKCYLRLERLRELDHELRRPEADFLRDGIYELRVSLQEYTTESYISSMGQSRQ